MLQSEFLELTHKKVIAPSEWELINMVYTWHPNISDVDGKKQVAYLYNNFGIAIFKDMEVRAKIARDLNDRLNKKENEVCELQEDLNRLKNGEWIGE